MWKETNNELHKQFTFKDFAEAFGFMAEVAKLAEKHDHHPRWQNEWNKLDIWLCTHSAGDTVTDKDKDMAKEIDSLLKPQKTKPGGSLPEQVKLFADGGSRGNPGPSASGYVILGMNDEVIVRKGVYLGVTTNNQAEYIALKLGLDDAYKQGAKQVEVYLDSQLVVNQMKGVYKVRNKDLWPHHSAIQTIAGKLEKVTYTHVPRALNKLADAMVNESLDAQSDV